MPRGRKRNPDNMTTRRRSTHTVVQRLPELLDSYKADAFERMTAKTSLTPKHVATFADWLESIGSVSTAQVIRNISKQDGHAAALKLVQQVLQQLSARIAAERGSPTVKLKSKPKS